MDPSRWQRIKDAFHAALDIAPGERSRFLEAELGDPALVEEVARLLEADDDATAYLARGATDLTSRERERGSLEVGARIGPYRVRRCIGTGGMGEVYEADQLEPIERRVALKVIRRGMDTREVVARFESERQALAMMSHVGIAQVYEAGVTDGGRPYFAMEYVQGLPITEYCDLHRLSHRCRLDLFLDVCSAVQHAHQRGVIHRDLKPSNLLVAGQGDSAVPKVIDFGVAKATTQSLTDKTLATQLGQWIGTPEYMSPEQADLGMLDVDVRTDVYALGVVLYELLVGARPFDADTLRAAGFDEIRRVIREEDPPKPSTRVSTLGEGSTTAAANRCLDPGTLRRELSGDLDAITMKALEKDRIRRYPSALDLAEDVSRYLRDEPVLAQPPSVVYQARKLFLRHKLIASAALAVLAVVLFGASATLWQARVARFERDRAERRFSQMRELLDSFLFEVYDGIEELPGATPVRRTVVDRALSYLEPLAREVGDEPDLLADLVSAYVRVGDVLGLPARSNLGDYAGAERSYERALELAHRLYEVEPTSSSRRMLGLAHLRRADLVSFTRSEREAESGYARAYELAGGDAKGLGEDPELRSLFTVAGSALATSLTDRGRWREGLGLHREVHEIERAELAADPDDVEKARDVAITYALISQAWELGGRIDRAIEALESARRVMLDALPPDGTHAGLRRELTFMDREIARLLVATDRATEAAPRLERATSELEALIQLDPDDLLLTTDLGVARAEAAKLHIARGDPEVALEQLDRVLEIERGLPTEVRASTEVRAYVAVVHRYRAEALIALGDLSGALSEYEWAVQAGEESLEMDSTAVAIQAELVRALGGTVAAQLAAAGGSEELGAHDRICSAANRRRELLASLARLEIDPHAAVPDPVEDSRIAACSPDRVRSGEPGTAPNPEEHVQTAG